MSMIRRRGCVTYDGHVLALGGEEADGDVDFLSVILGGESAAVSADVLTDSWSGLTKGDQSQWP